MADIAAAGVLAPLDGILPDWSAKEAEDFPGYEAGVLDKTLYALYLENRIFTLWYRRDLLEKAKLPVPRTWDELAKAAKDLADRARAGRLNPDDMADGTFTVSNLGGLGVEGFTPIVNLPQAGILGVGRIMEKPVVLNGGIHIRSMVTLSLVFDHRLIDGAPAAKFLAKVKALLEQPAWVG